MRFTFLGTGTSAGIPAIACDCGTCTSDDPRDKRLRTGAAVQWVDSNGQDRTVLIDATPDLRQQALTHHLTRCDAVLFTHNHVDHVFGLDEVRRFNMVMQAPINVYAEDHTMDSLRRVFQHVFESHNNVNQSFVATLIPRTIEPELPLDLHGLRFTPIRLLHGRLPILGFRIEPSPGSRIKSDFLPMAYCTDTSKIPPETYPSLTDLRTLVLDCLRHRHHPTHLTLDQAIATASEIAAGKTWFVHMAHEIRHAEVDAMMPTDEMRLAWDGLTLGG